MPWRKLERYVFQLQKRIYRARQRGDWKTVRGLQRLLRRSRAAKTLAVRRVTQDNDGKKTPGVDGVAKLTPKERLEMVQTMNLSDKAHPVRRIWIPKPGKTELRPLGIPTMMDRAKQALVKMVLSPNGRPSSSQTVTAFDQAEVAGMPSMRSGQVSKGPLEFIPLSFWYDAPPTSRYSDRRHDPWLVYSLPSYSLARWSSWISRA